MQEVWPVCADGGDATISLSEGRRVAPKGSPKVLAIHMENRSRTAAGISARERLPRGSGSNTGSGRLVAGCPFSLRLRYLYATAGAAFLSGAGGRKLSTTRWRPKRRRRFRRGRHSRSVWFLSGVAPPRSGVARWLFPASLGAHLAQLDQHLPKVAQVWPSKLELSQTWQTQQHMARHNGAHRWVSFAGKPDMVAYSSAQIGITRGS